MLSDIDNRYLGIIDVFFMIVLMQDNRGTWIGHALHHCSLAIDRFIIVGDFYIRWPDYIQQKRESFNRNRNWNSFPTVASDL